MEHTKKCHHWQVLKLGKEIQPPMNNNKWHIVILTYCLLLQLPVCPAPSFMVLDVRALPFEPLYLTHTHTHMDMTMLMY